MDRHVEDGGRAGRSRPHAHHRAVGRRRGPPVHRHPASDALARRGLAGKQRDPDDRRLTVVALTEAGAAVVADVLRSRRALIRQVTAQLPSADALAIGAAPARFAEAADGTGRLEASEVDHPSCAATRADRVPAQQQGRWPACRP